MNYKILNFKTNLNLIEEESNYNNLFIDNNFDLNYYFSKLYLFFNENDFKSLFNIINSIIKYLELTNENLPFNFFNLNISKNLKNILLLNNLIELKNETIKLISLLFKL